MTASTKVIEVAKQQALNLSERYDGYRAAIARALIDVIRIQQEGLSEKGRRDKALKTIEALGTKVLITLMQGEVSR